MMGRGGGGVMVRVARFVTWYLLDVSGVKYYKINHLRVRQGCFSVAGRVV